MEDKIKIVPGSVQETLIIPLYGRKLCSERFASLYTDKSAARICARLDYDFSDLDAHAKSTFWQFGALEAAMRQIDMEWEIRDYLATREELAPAGEREHIIVRVNECPAALFKNERMPCRFVQS